MYIFILAGVIFVLYEFGFNMPMAILEALFADLVESQLKDSTGREYLERADCHRTVSTETKAEWIAPDEHYKLRQKLQQAEFMSMDLRKQIVDARGASQEHLRQSRRSIMIETEMEWIQPDEHYMLKQKLHQAEATAMELRQQLHEARDATARNIETSHSSIMIEKQLADSQATNERLGTTLTSIANGTHFHQQSQPTPPASPVPTIIAETESHLAVEAPPPPPPLPPKSKIQPKAMVPAKKPKSPPKGALPASMDEVLAELVKKRATKAGANTWSSPRSRRLSSPYHPSPIKSRSPTKKLDTPIGRTPTKGPVTSTIKISNTPQKSSLPLPHRRRESYRIGDSVSAQALARHHLRKTNIPRSPGGTTLIPPGAKKRTALTWNDVAADAMRKKFAKAFPKEDVSVSDGEWTDDEGTPMKSMLQRSKTIH
ncbi:hypothetical protein SeMB42_g00360 [Synchytrium endobioticum]|uniref:Uncharacterized protein n=1 Tax=Synchytrium endobioticum TaxID=286115 RepID=A0A507DRC9_9FUNG|nr:hypothetical protein SeMB42_g00360 [Synchytrium endobioticum]